MLASSNSTPLENAGSFSFRPTSPLQTEDAKTRKFPEGKVYAIVVISFFVCENLTNTWLPALGLRTLAHQYENVADFIFRVKGPCVHAGAFHSKGKNTRGVTPGEDILQTSLL